MLFVAALLAVSLRAVIDIGQPLFADDIWWHIALGRVFLDTAHLPVIDPLLFTNAGHPQFYQEWLFQVLVAALDAGAGLGGLRLLQVVLVGAVLHQIYVFARSQGLGSTLAIAVALCLLLFAFQRIVQLRPHLLTMLCFYSTLNLYCVREMTLRRATILMLVVIIWTNVHATVLIVFPFLIVYLAIVDGRVSLRSRNHLRVFGVALGAVMLNPQGWRVYFFYFIHDANNALTHVVDEWGRLFLVPRGFEYVLPWSSTLIISAYCAVTCAVLSGIFFFHTAATRSESRIRRLREPVCVGCDGVNCCCLGCAIFVDDADRCVGWGAIIRSIRLA